MDFARRGQDFWAAPFPSDDLSSAAGFPTRRIDLVERGVKIAFDQGGFAGAGGVFFPLSGPVDAKALPDLTQSVRAESRVFLLRVEDLERTPVYVSFRADGGPFGAPNQLALLPLQGIPLRPRTLYAAVVLRSLPDAQGKPLGVSLPMAQLAAGEAPAGLGGAALDHYRRAVRALQAAGVRPGDVAGLAAFTTGDPAAELLEFRTDALARPAPALIRPFMAGEVFPDFCVYAATLGMPQYQAGTPPYASSGGGWTRDPQGRPQLQRTEEANLVVTVPRAPMPAAGFPVAVFIRTGGGGDRPLVDRGPRATAGGPATAPGTGPARQFARAGFAGVSVDGPLGGRRNPNNGDEQFLIFNILNPVALRDNVRQSALELSLLPRLLDSLSLDAGACGAPAARFDTSRLALMGHSMGGTIAPLVLRAEPRYRAAILSGAGGSWIENVMWKKRPLEVRPLAEMILGYAPGALQADDPVLTLVQWAAEPADPQVYARNLVREGRHVLMVQGIVDHYILPRIANGISLALGLDLGGDELDQEIPGQTPLGQVLPLAGGRALRLPAGGNVSGMTAIVVQQREDGIEDGHEVIFQTAAPQEQYRCFLKDFAGSDAAPKVRAPGAACD